MKKARYILFEGLEGTGKGTQVANLVKYLEGQGFKVLSTKEPGTPHLPFTMELRKIMLDQDHDSSLTIPSREYISQSIRSIHLEKLIKPALSEYDFIIQDRGILSALAYGEACKNEPQFLKDLANYVVRSSKTENSYSNLYDQIIVLDGDATKGLQRAKAAKQEFASGDAMENKGNTFLEEVGENFKKYSQEFKEVHWVSVDSKSIDQVFEEIKICLKI